MKILVTGATGFIGNSLTKKMVEQNIEVYALVRATSDISNIDSRICPYVYTNDAELVDYFQRNRFSGVIHLASLFLANHSLSEIQNLIDSNIKFGTVVLEACKISKVQWFINTGTFWQNYLSEKYNPVNLYAATKEAFEDIAKYYTQTSNLTFTTIKLNDTYGPRDKRNKIINTLKKISHSKETLNMSCGNQIIDMVYMDDVVDAFMLLIKYLCSNDKTYFNNKTFAVLAEKRLTLRQLVEKFEKITNVKLNINWGALEYREREVMNPCSNYETIPLWKPKVSLDDGLKKIYKEDCSE